MVMLHGVPANSWTRKHYLPEFSATDKVYVSYLPGYNLSQGLGLDTQYRVENMMAIIAEFMSVVNNRSKEILPSLA